MKFIRLLFTFYKSFAVTSFSITFTCHLYEHIIDICDDIYVLLNGKTYLTKNKKDLIKLGYLHKKENF
jgi:ABC-type sugar transport system ATPase subunit